MNFCQDFSDTFLPRGWKWALNSNLQGIIGILFVVLKGTNKQLSCAQQSKAGAQLPDVLKMKDVVRKCRAMPIEKPKALYSTNNIEMDLARLLKVRSLWLFGLVLLYSISLTILRFSEQHHRAAQRRARETTCSICSGR